MTIAIAAQDTLAMFVSVKIKAAPLLIGRMIYLLSEVSSGISSTDVDGECCFFSLFMI